MKCPYGTMKLRAQRATDETIVAEKGTVIGVSVSINSGDGSKFKNIYLRDGGGIIGLNDWTKMPSITLG